MKPDLETMVSEYNLPSWNLVTSHTCKQRSRNVLVVATANIFDDAISLQGFSSGCPRVVVMVLWQLLFSLFLHLALPFGGNYFC